jgi:hypothetical protein
VTPVEERIDWLLDEEGRGRFSLAGIAEVFIDPTYDLPGAVEYDPDGSPVIVLREYDERVLLHECVHAIFAREQEARSALGDDAEERIVRHLTRALYAVGWRLRETDRSIAQVEHELNETARQRDELARQLDGEGTRDFDCAALPATESAQPEEEPNA